MSEEELIGYCVKCRKKQTMEDAERVVMKNGRPAAKGKCSECGGGIYLILAVDPAV